MDAFISLPAAPTAPVDATITPPGIAPASGRGSQAASRLPKPCRDECRIVQHALSTLTQALDWPAVIESARPWVDAVRREPPPFWAMVSLLREYPINSAEGLALMRLAEALLRVPDVPTAIALTADQLGKAAFGGPDGGQKGSHRMMAQLSSSAISLSKKFLPEAERDGGLIQRLGSQTVVAATVRAIELLGRQFVIGRHIGEAMAEAQAARRAAPHLRYSYDMLGEGARTEADAQRYLASYLKAIHAIAGGRAAAGPHDADGISIKLSALFSRYEESQRPRVFGELLPRAWQLVTLAARANINLTIDAEESDRLELSLDVFEALIERIARGHPRWGGFGLAIQAYQTRSLEVVDAVAGMARKHGLTLMVRLVKGAYWDGEIKRAQELGLSGYPVHTHKHHTDVAYLACAEALLSHADVIYPQFATHNAGTIAAVLQMGRRHGAAFEMQRLHGMGEGIYREVVRHAAGSRRRSARVPTAPSSGARSDAVVPVRVYAPVGEHRDLLAYLVRRLLENGANSSFVHQLTDDAVDVASLLATPLVASPQPALPLPRDICGRRAHARGVDLAAVDERLPLEAAIASTRWAPVAGATIDEVSQAMERLQSGFAAWSVVPVAQRAAVLRAAASALESRLPEFCGLLVKEAHKTLADAVPEVREAVDFCRYYADQAESTLAGAAGATASTGSNAHGSVTGRGVFVCISPWNFPLAIFAGQVVAALVTGNTVAAKPAEQTPAVAARLMALLHEAGVPRDALVLLHGPGETVGAALVGDVRTAGVCFTGSTPVACLIHRRLARRSGPPVPLIAETGGINAMVVDSTALPEQVIDAVVQSAFRSAGQRCSALRLLCLHESVAGPMIEMLAGAMKELRVGDPAQFSTDVGPVIDAQAHAGLSAHVARLRRHARLIAETPAPEAVPGTIAPVAFEVDAVADVAQEIFGPVLHVVRWGGDVDALVAQINALGYGLTLGIQTRIDSRALRIADAARIGNVYVNRNTIGAVVGVQPFGGEGLSGTGPKAGGPNYLYRFCAEPAGDAAPDTVGPATPGALAGPQAATMAALRKAFVGWSRLPLADRAAIWRHLADEACAHEPGITAAMRRSVDLSERLLATRHLPGPTGERNELRHHGRGVFLLADTGKAAMPAVASAIAAVLMAGNALVVTSARHASMSAWQARLEAAGLPRGAFACRPSAELAAWLAQPELAGVCHLGDLSAVSAAQRAIAEREGPILPLIRWPNDPALLGPQQVVRLAAEQTLTINTAAAGGNVDLLVGLRALS